NDKANGGRGVNYFNQSAKRYTAGYRSDREHHMLAINARYFTRRSPADKSSINSRFYFKLAGEWHIQKRKIELYDDELSYKRFQESHSRAVCTGIGNHWLVQRISLNLNWFNLCRNMVIEHKNKFEGNGDITDGPLKSHHEYDLSDNLLKGKFYLSTQIQFGLHF
ncbi:MAG: hypothetical protein CMP10_14710, partial [Zetaproteobacteria bacterium]|nr:hypothetical protein [Pseudobdellovibrionaceae bacterium]